MKRKKIELNRANIVLIAGIIIILIPFVLLAVMLITDYAESHNPILGSRLKNERTVEISNSQLNTLSSEITKNSNVEKCNIELKVATVRISVDVNDSVEAEGYEALLGEIYQTVDKQLAISDYFTSKGSEKEYDLEIHAYNDLEKAGSDDYIYYTLTKNASNSQYIIDINSQAKNEALAKELRGETTTVGVIEGEGSDEAKDGE